MTDASDLISLVVTLAPTAKPAPDRPLPRWWGRAVHAAALQAIAARSPKLADELHDASAPRPFTVSNLQGRFNQGSPIPGETYRIRLTGLTAPVAAALQEAAAPGGLLAPGATLQLDYLPFNVQAVNTADNPWAASARYADILQACSLSSQPPDRRLRLQFASPTCFHKDEKTMPLPLPDLVFGSLLQRWNAFAPLTLPEDTRRYAAECLALSNFRLASRLAGMKEDSLRVGCTGSVTYTSLNPDRYWLGLMHSLAAFAIFSGVGVGTAQGLGQCRQVTRPPE